MCVHLYVAPPSPSYLPPSPLPVFGVDLTIVVKMYNTKTPIVLKHCISEVERRGGAPIAVHV